MLDKSIIRELRAKAEKGTSRLTHKKVDMIEGWLEAPSPKRAHEIKVEAERPKPKPAVRDGFIYAGVATMAGSIAWLLLQG